MTDLLTLPGGNPKTAKGVELHGYATAVHHLAPKWTSKVRDVCLWSSPGCVASCLNTAGRGGIFRKGETTNHIQQARIKRTIMMEDDPGRYEGILWVEIARFVGWCRKKGYEPAVRLNGTSDIPWEEEMPGIFRNFMGVSFYDYTKSYDRMLHSMLHKPVEHWPKNYHLAFSRTEDNWDDCLKVLKLGGNVAVVATKDTKEKFLERGWYREPWRDDGTYYEVVDGDTHDYIPGRGKHKVLLLSAKGKAKEDTRGFVVREFT